MNENITVFITKYAFTEGIIIASAEKCSSPKIVKVLSSFFHKPYWHTSAGDAIIHAQCMRIKKIASLKKQIEKLENMTFTLKDL